MLNRLNKFLCLIFLVGFASCSANYKEINDKSVEKLRSQIIEGKYEEIYAQSTSLVKSTISKAEFIERMEVAVKAMKEVDENLNWQKGGNEDNFYNDFPVTENSYRELVKDKKRIGIFIYWSDFNLCGFEISSSVKGSQIKVVNGCS
jgi:hypothetical protein